MCMNYICGHVYVDGFDGVHGGYGTGQRNFVGIDCGERIVLVK